MKRIGLLFMAAVFLLGSSWTLDKVNAAGTKKEVINKQETKRVIVKLKKPAEKTNLKGIEVLTNQESKKEPIVTIEVPEGKKVDSYIKELEKRDDVEFAEPDHIIKLDHTPNDTYFDYQWHHETIQTESAWDKSKGSSSVVVAVIDNGIDLTHSDLKNRIVSPYDTVYDSSTTLTAGDHGTHVAGIIGSSMDNYLGTVGVAPNTSIMPIDAFYGESAYASDVIEGIYYAVNNGADVINMSLGSSNYNYSYDAAIQYAHENGVVIVAAAGNDGTSTMHYPAAYDNVIAVGSTTESDSRSYFSNYGYWVDIMAPGSYIYSTLPYSSYGSMSGTSMASPVVAGVAALILANEPNLSNYEVEQRLYDTADYLGSSYYYGNGRVNARRALGIADKITSPTVYSVYDYDTSVTGYTSGYDYYDIEVTDGKKVLGKVNDNGYFSVTIPKQKAGTKLYVTAKSNGNSSDAVEITVQDGTAPTNPKVNEISDQHKAISGTAEAGVTVYAMIGNSTYSATANSIGAFSITIPLQKAGTTVYVWAKDSAGYYSNTSTYTVKDKTGPAAPAVNNLTEKSTTVTGKTEAGAKVSVKIGTNTYTANASSSGSFSVTIPLQKPGTAVEVWATDKAGNKGVIKKVIVKDTTPPPAPSVGEISDKSTQVSGTSEKGSTVTVKFGINTYITVAENGKFAVPIFLQKAGTVFEIWAVDVYGNKSTITKVITKDKTAPKSPVVNAVTSKSTSVTGTSEANATVIVKIGTKSYTAKAATNGAFSVKIPVQKANVTLTVTATDGAKNVSTAVKIIVKK
ncbi:Ig-like domain-containing protein [Fictibacillus sp. JL2B1089]|uniref:S8 family peptidase n=1 Tax=Fictibacillus sp. JL2B1089 TaxID=3399565 RepID=UPI003A87CFCF